MKQYDVIIVGGGLAGLTAALHLSRSQRSVLVLEKRAYPHHKVCGEYLSNEVKPYLDRLGVSLPQPAAIHSLLLSTVKGTTLETKLPLGGMGISRYALDHALFKRVLQSGVPVVSTTAKSITYRDGAFEVATPEETYTSRVVIGAYGKRSHLDKYLGRSFIRQKSPWLGVKAHYRLDGFPDHAVELHHFHGGYGGLSKTESGDINFCYLVNYRSFELFNDIHNFNTKIVSKNPFLRQFLQTAIPLFDQPLSIAQISFERKQMVENHVLMCGDTAGLIHPLCGNGMAMAIHSAKIASECILSFFRRKEYDRHQLETDYQQQWKATFGRRMMMGRRLQALLLHPTLADTAIRIATRSPTLVRSLIARTHGKPLTI